MSFHATVLKRSCLALFLVGFVATPAAFGQLKNAQGVLIAPIAFANQQAITTSFAPTPVSLNSTTASDASQWLKVEFHYGATPALTTKYLDSVEFKVWIEGFDPLAANAKGGKGASVALTGSVTYVNVPASKDLYGVFYVHPSTLGRYSDGEHGVDDFDKKFDVHVEAYVGGVMIDRIDKNKEKDPEWFKALTAVPNLVYRQDQCPFLMTDPDRYPAIKLASPSAP